MDVRGTVIQELDRDEVAAIAQDFKARGIQAVAVSLLHSYRNPAHEEEVRRIIHEGVSRLLYFHFVGHPARIPRVRTDQYDLPEHGPDAPAVRVSHPD